MRTESWREWRKLFQRNHLADPESLLPASTRKPILLAWSGGKDSTLALHTLRASTEWHVVGLLTTVTETYDRISMHGVRRSLLEDQATSLGLPLTIVRIPAASSNDTYESRMGEALERARADGITAVAFGDLYLAEVRSYREAMLSAVGMIGVFPVWGRPTSELATEFIELGYRAVLTCVDTTQIPGELAGRAFDESLLTDLPPSADPCGENGEFHTFVHTGPLFAHPIDFRHGETVLRDMRFAYHDLLRPDEQVQAV